MMSRLTYDNNAIMITFVPSRSERVLLSALIANPQNISNTTNDKFRDYKDNFMEKLLH